MSYESDLQFAVNLARQAGELMRQNLGKADTTWKSDNTPVTETDIAINKMVIEAVRANYPKDGIMGEESSYESDRSRKWVVDPIDGTQPFDIGAPLSTFCLGYVVEDQPVLGVVYDPFSDKMHTAVKGQGAFLNDQPISASKAVSINNQYTFVSSRMGGSYATAGEAADKFAELGGKCFNFRSIVYGLMCVASGAAVVAVAGYSRPWDIAAAQVILQESGASFTDLGGGPVNYLDSPNGVLACSEPLRQQIVDLLKAPNR